MDLINLSKEKMGRKVVSGIINKFVALLKIEVLVSWVLQ